MKIVFASNNPGKLHEVRSILGKAYDLSGLQEIGCHDDIPEPFHTLEENALAKARHVFQYYGMNCFADDTGLEVEALGGLPGVQSARFAGESRSSEANVSKLLTMMQGLENRRAQFRTVMALIINGKEHLFEGIVRGTIAKTPSGTGGFGYDPVFIPDGFTETFAQMPDTQKNKLSHRYEALKKMATLLRPDRSNQDHI